MATADKLNKLLDTKAAIKQAIIDKGVEVSDDTVFADYPAKISAIESGGSGDTTTYEHPDFYEFRTNGGTNYDGLFYYCSLTSLDLSNFDTSNVTTMKWMFSDCSSLTSLDLSNFNTSNVTDMKYMFHSCTNLTSLDVSNFDTSNVTDMQYMFHSCRNLTSLDVSNFDTSNVTDMQYMFHSCRKLTSLDVSNFDTSNVTRMAYVFAYCYDLTSLDVSSFDTSNITTMMGIFADCESLTSLDLSNWDVSNLSSTGTSSAFYNCTALTDLQAPKNIGVKLDVSRCTNLTHDSLMSIINNLVTVTTTTKLTLGTTNLAKLTDEEKAIATSKGWTLA